MVGVALATFTITVPVDGVSVVSVGVKVTASLWPLPAFSTVPTSVLV